jgi:hypothetical protein
MRSSLRAWVVALLPLSSLGSLACAAGCGRSAPIAAASASDGGARAPAALVARPFPLPGATGPAFLDYIVYEPAAHRVWVPVGSTGSVDLLDTAAGTFARVDGFETVQREGRGATRTMGPSAASIGGGVAYIGNRGTSEVCAVDVHTLRRGKCLAIAGGIDGVSYVAPTKEVWVTVPGEKLLAVLDVAAPGRLELKTTIELAGEPEGYAVDEERGLFFTNLEDRGGTVVIDVKTRKPRATWNAGCGSDGPRGVAFDRVHDFVLVACTDRVQVLDAAHDGSKLGTLDTGAGVDNIDFVPEKRLVYVAAGKAARLTVARVDDKGAVEVVATGATAPGARNVVADEQGRAYVADTQGARVLVFDAP